MHAAQTRELILNAAYSLFLDRGYEKTTMEEIAATAEVGTTTLYRYYPSKDLLVVGPLELRGQMADELRSRPADEPLDIALGHAVEALAVTPRADTARMLQIQQVLDATPSLGVRIYQEFLKERLLLRQAIADRVGKPADGLFCQSTAHMATMVVELVGGLTAIPGSSADNAKKMAALLQTTLRDLAADPPVLPRVESASTS